MTKVITYGSIHDASMNEKVELFHNSLLPYFDEKKRDMPWRHLAEDANQRFYQVLVSEMMLQQTQVQRVMGKYIEWMTSFPHIEDVARSSFAEILSSWNGLGYSRRAKYLMDISTKVVEDGIPSTVEQLIAHKGIGANTAGAIMAYYLDQPTVFIETNIRTVLFHHFYGPDEIVSDKDLCELMSVLIDSEHPRLWYWAMMDYGAELKKVVKNISQSQHYKKQSRFEGSDRQLRSLALRSLLSGPVTYEQFLSTLESKVYIFDTLVKEGMVILNNGYVELSEK